MLTGRSGIPRRRNATALDDAEAEGLPPQPLRRVYIPKRATASGPSRIPTMKDRAMQALYLLALDPIAETTADPELLWVPEGTIHGRRHRQCPYGPETEHAPQWIFEGDITSALTGSAMNGYWLIFPWRRAILQKWLKAGFMEKHVLSCHRGRDTSGRHLLTRAGEPDAGWPGTGREGTLPDSHPRAGRCKVNLVRYADDFIITGSSENSWRRGQTSGGAVPANEDWNSPPRRRGSRISRTALISSDRTYASTMASS